MKKEEKDIIELKAHMRRMLAISFENVKQTYGSPSTYEDVFEACKRQCRTAALSALDQTLENLAIDSNLPVQ